ncbi:RHS repeat protein [bacterium]|nr:RHS repeat protein [bacterium]
MRALVLALSAWLCLSANALTVNRLNGSASVTYIDFVLPGNIPMELVRTYNSITAASEQRGWLGAFGWGWTAPFETTMTTTPDRKVLLRDGANGNTVVFRPEKEDPKVMADFLEELKQAYFEREKGMKLSKSEASKLNLPERIASNVRTDPDFRNEMAAKYGIKGKIPVGQVLISSEFGYQTVYQKGNQWIRTREAYTQTFDSDGRLIRQRDNKGNVFTFTYSASQKFQLEEIRDANKTASLRLKWKNERVAEVSDNRGNKATYTYDPGGNLIQVTDSDKQTYRYVYDNKKFPHLLTRIDYITESKAKPVYREIRYDDSALVVFHHEKDGDEVAFSYGKIARDPENNFWTKSVHTKNGVKDEMYDEFLIKAHTDGTKYLYRQENKQNGVTTITTYNPCCGQPLEISKNGAVTAFKYYADGLLKERVGPNEDVQIEYDARWKKVSHVKQNGSKYDYTYDATGNLTQAKNDKNEVVSLKYDKQGRIAEMGAGPDRNITFKYGDIGKPVLISQAGVGSIKLSYDSHGRIRAAESIAEPQGRKPSKDDNKEIVRKVMRNFQLLLDILRPAGVGVAMG